MQSEAEQIDKRISKPQFKRKQKKLLYHAARRATPTPQASTESPKGWTERSRAVVVK